MVATSEQVETLDEEERHATAARPQQKQPMSPRARLVDAEPTRRQCTGDELDDNAAEIGEQRWSARQVLTTRPRRKAAEEFTKNPLEAAKAFRPGRAVRRSAHRRELRLPVARGELGLTKAAAAISAIRPRDDADRARHRRGSFRLIAWGRCRLDEVPTADRPNARTCVSPSRRSDHLIPSLVVCSNTAFNPPTRRSNTAVPAMASLRAMGARALVDERFEPAAHGVHGSRTGASDRTSGSCLTRDRHQVGQGAMRDRGSTEVKARSRPSKYADVDTMTGHSKCIVATVFVPPLLSSQ